jgi:hypothetical protein
LGQQAGLPKPAIEKKRWPTGVQWAYFAGRAKRACGQARAACIVIISLMYVKKCEEFSQRMLYLVGTNPPPDRLTFSVENIPFSIDTSEEAIVLTAHQS